MVSGHEPDLTPDVRRGRDHPSVTAPLLASGGSHATGWLCDNRPSAAKLGVIAVVRERSKRVCQPSTSLSTRLSTGGGA